MKAWRKHNQRQAETARNLQYKLSYNDSTPAERKQLELKYKQAVGLRLRTKTERRMQYASEVAKPSYLLIGLLHRVGLWTAP